MIGVEMVLRTRSTRARKNMTASGVAGRNMASGGGWVQTSVGVGVGSRSRDGFSQSPERAVQAPGRRGRSGGRRPASAHAEEVEWWWYYYGCGGVWRAAQCEAADGVVGARVVGAVATDGGAVQRVQALAASASPRGGCCAWPIAWKYNEPLPCRRYEDAPGNGSVVARGRGEAQ